MALPLYRRLFVPAALEPTEQLVLNTGLSDVWRSYLIKKKQLDFNACAEELVRNQSVVEK